MTQIAINFDAHRAARSDDPETSHAAARNAERFAASHAGRILAALKLHGPRTAHELEALVGLSVVQIDRRLPELKAAGLTRVAKLDDGADRVVDGFRVWEAV
jgi:predicted ArsR family transcriptional regulator